MIGAHRLELAQVYELACNSFLPFLKHYSVEF